MERLRSDCLRCTLLGQLNACPETATEAEKIDYIQALMDILAHVPRTMSAPELMEGVVALQTRMFGKRDHYREVKLHFNEVMLRYLPKCREKVQASRDPLAMAMHYALVANYIDFGAMQNVQEEKLQALLDTETPVDPQAYREFVDELRSRKKLLYITDNCGEIVMDRLLIETIRERFPGLSIHVLVRGEPVLNDATLEDARQVGLLDLVPVTGNGTAIAGTSLPKISPEAQSLWDEADLILSKGQGNFETLRMCGKNVFYLFLCKCDMFAREFQVPKLTGMLLRDRDL